MEYTKDIILGVNYKRKLGLAKLVRSIKDIIKNNKYLFFTLTFLILLIVVDLILVSTFLNIITNSYI